MKRSRKLYIPTLNIMIVGRTLVGKTTFLRTFLNSLDIHGSASLSLISELPTLKNEVAKYPTLQVTLEHSKVALTIIDTPGLCEDGDGLHTCLEFIEQQFESHLQEEMKVNRNPVGLDNMIHAVLYLLPQGPLSELDLEAIQQLQRRTNVVPLMARADTVTQKQCLVVREQLRKSLQPFNALHFLESGEYEDEDTELYLSEVKSFYERVPMSVVGAEFDSGDPFVHPKALPLTRVFSFGTLNIEDPKHSDLGCLKYLLFDFGLECIRAHVRISLYEKYRTDRLMSMKDITEYTAPS